MSCSHKAGDIIFEKTKTVAVDETKTVLLRYPQKLTIINDSSVIVINSGQKLSEYNFYSGKNTRNFSLAGFNFDSLISATYRKKHEGIKKYIYEKGYELNGNNYQLINYFHSANSNYILVSLLAQVDNLQDSSQLMNLRETEEIKKPGDDVKDSRIIIMDYVNFIFETDTEFNIRTIFPLYAETEIRKNNYYAYFHKNFFVQGDTVYVPIGKTGGQMHLEEKIDTDKDNYNLAKIDLKRNTAGYLLPNKDADFTDYRLQDYFDSECNYMLTDGRLAISTGKEVIEPGTSEIIFYKKELKPTEWIYKCYKKDNFLVMTTYTKQHGKSIVMNGHSLPVDSIIKEEIKVFDIKQQKWTGGKTLPAEAKGTALSAKQLVYISKDDKHYYFNSISYEY